MVTDFVTFGGKRRVFQRESYLPSYLSENGKTIFSLRDVIDVFECSYDNAKMAVERLEEILAEKIRSIIQRGKSRDYYDVWMMVKVRKFDLDKIRRLIVEKCRYRNIDFSVERIFDEDRLRETGKFWETGLRDLVKKLPDFDLLAGLKIIFSSSYETSNNMPFLILSLLRTSFGIVILPLSST